MLEHNDLKPGVRFMFEGVPYEVIESKFVFKGRGSSTTEAKIRNLLNGKVITKVFHTGDEFEEIEIEKKKVIFLYSKQDKYYFALAENPKERFELSKEILEKKALFLKEKDELTGLFFNDKLINIEMPLRIQLKVVSAPPGIKGGREQPGTKPVVLENGITLQVPLFIKEGDIIEINTETGEYIRRVN